MRMRQGLFLTFEGVDGSGKSLQCRRLAHRLGAEGGAVVLTREPGGTPLGDDLRRLLLHPTADGRRPRARTEALLFAADRAEHVATVIRPALAAGRIVICDRFADSTRAYQGYGRRADAALIETLIALATDGLSPDLTILLDLDVAEAQRRLATRARQAEETPTHFDRETLDFHNRVRDGFLTLAAAEPNRFHVLDGAQSPDDLHAAAYALVSARLSA